MLNISSPNLFRPAKTINTAKKKTPMPSTLFIVSRAILLYYNLKFTIRDKILHSV